MKKTLAFILFLLWSVSAFAVPYGQDYLGGARYVNTIIKTHDLKQGAGFFSNTFGDSLPVAANLATRGVVFIRFHLMWKDDHNFRESDFPAIVKEAKRVCVVSQRTKLYLSGACEHRLNQMQAHKLADLIKAACPAAIVVNTPLAQGAVLSEYINEIHGGGKPRSANSAFSFDGTAAEDSDVTTVKSSFASSQYFMIWGPRYNGRWESNDSTPRPQRKGWPDESYIKSMIYLTTDKGTTAPPKNWLWKSHSENKGNGDPRAEKPVAIVPIKANQLELKQGGKTVETMRYYGSYTDGRSRYYSSKWGYQLGKVDIYAKGKKLGTVNAGFRSGDYR